MQDQNDPMQWVVYINQESTFKNQAPTLWLTVHRKEVGAEERREIQSLLLTF